MAREGDDLADVFPAIHKQMRADIHRSNRLGTKENHIVIIKDWFRFCAKIGVYPYTKNPKPLHIIYFCYDRAGRMRKGANSIENWLAAFNFMILSLNGTPSFRTLIFNRHKKALVKFHSQPRTVKLPFKLKWLAQWARAIGVTPLTWYTCDFNNLIKVLIVLTIFFTISRPGEIYFTNKTENEEWDIITTGIRFGDVSFSNTH